MVSPRAIVLAGDGVNCENETVHALRLGGFEAESHHVSRLLSTGDFLTNSDLLVLPGGFSFGDEIQSGKVLALKIMSRLKEEIDDFVERGKLIIGICNGFQALVNMRLLPGNLQKERKTVSLVHNEQKRFLDTWVDLDVPPSQEGHFFAGLEKIQLPVRHGEGRIVTSLPDEDALLPYCPLFYSEDVNGSLARMAALQNEEGTVLGMMPHPEAYVRWTQHPNWTGMKTRGEDFSCDPPGLLIFRNACQIARHS